jgi:hypothetical protein
MRPILVPCSPGSTGKADFRPLPTRFQLRSAGDDELRLLFFDLQPLRDGTWLRHGQIGLPGLWPRRIVATIYAMGLACF